jgi:hypothetical protein
MNYQLKKFSDLIKESKEDSVYKMPNASANYGEDSETGKYLCNECVKFIKFEDLSKQQQEYITENYPDHKGWNYGICTNVGLYSDEKSSMISGDYGSCQYFFGGDNAKPNNINENKISKVTANYQEVKDSGLEGFGCSRCEFFKEDNKPCAVLKEAVKTKGCCSAWTNQKVDHFKDVKK